MAHGNSFTLFLNLMTCGSTASEGNMNIHDMQITDRPPVIVSITSITSFSRLAW